MTHADTGGLEVVRQLQSEERAERKARRIWVSFILFLLIGSVGMWIYAAILAVSDPSMSVVPDYHEKALHWDEHLSSQRESARLNWTVHVIVGESVNSEGKRVLTLFVRNHESQPLVGATGQVRYYHHIRAKEHQTVTLKETESGTYEALVSMDRDGSWQFEIDLNHGNEHFTKSVEQDITLHHRSTDAASP